jgi:hypothetical protein
MRSRRHRLGPGSPRTCWQPGRVGGNARPNPRAVLNAIFYLLRTGASGFATPRVPAPFTITFVPGKMRASWPKCKGASRAGAPACPALRWSSWTVGRSRPPSAEASVVSMGTNGSKGANASCASSMLCAGCGPSIQVKQSLSL